MPITFDRRASRRRWAVIIEGLEKGCILEHKGITTIFKCYRCKRFLHCSLFYGHEFSKRGIPLLEGANIYVLTDKRWTHYVNGKAQETSSKTRKTRKLSNKLREKLEVS